MNDIPPFTWPMRLALWLYWAALQLLTLIFGPWSRCSRTHHERTHLMVRAKFVVENIEDAGEGLKTLSLRAVYGGVEGNENTEFWRYTPAGFIQLSTINPAASSQFVLGAEVYVDFTPVIEA